jgi:hypothetical protein
MALLPVTQISGPKIAVIARESGRSSIPETLVFESIGCGVLDRPVKPGDDIDCDERTALQ